jgi:hypothetical protein
MNIEDSVEKIGKLNLHENEKLLICALLRNGLRISEIADTSKITIISSTEISICQFKTNSFRIIPIFEYNDVLKKILKTSNKIFHSRSRWYYYRLFRTIGITQIIEGHKNLSVTHSARYERATSIYNATQDINQAASAIGHKTTTATEGYITTKRKRRQPKSEIETPPIGDISNIRITKNKIMLTTNN